MTKYHNVISQLDGYRFDSQAEMRRYVELKIMLRAKEISDLELQPVFPILINGIKICTYRGDFSYQDQRTGKKIVEDVKGMKTPLYRLKKKLFEALYNQTITEIS